MTVEEVEALRLKDMDGLEQEACAERMGVSRPTFQRILTGARGKVTRALVEGKAIKVEGGNFEYVARRLRCGKCRTEWEPRLPGDKDTICPKCGSETATQLPAKYGGKRGMHRHQGEYNKE